MKRRKAREYALQMLFQLDFGTEKPDAAFFSRFWQNLDEPQDVKKFAEDLVKGAAGHIEELDRLITENAENWVLDRMAIVDRNILRSAAYELVFKEEIPPAVVINEAIEVAKKFSMKESASFINGILDKIARIKGRA
ncbi:MAG: transcription antitermination factor NusB [Actinomycetota bacterium]|nr:transcription antitermination factor NusB [Actinomycetota bacterium]